MLIDEFNAAVAKVNTSAAKLSSAAAGLKGGLTAGQAQTAISSLNGLSASLDADTASLADTPAPATT